MGVLYKAPFSSLTHNRLHCQLAAAHALNSKLWVTFGGSEDDYLLVATHQTQLGHIRDTSTSAICMIGVMCSFFGSNEEDKYN